MSAEFSRPQPKPRLPAHILEQRYEKWSQHQHGPNPYDLYDELPVEDPTTEAPKATVTPAYGHDEIIALPQEADTLRTDWLELDEFTGAPRSALTASGDIVPVDPTDLEHIA